MAERTVSATEARVHFGELLDSVVRKQDIVFVERSGKPQAVVVSVEEWERHTTKEDPWVRAAREMEAHWAYMDEAVKEGRVNLDGWDSVEELRKAREERSEQLLRNSLGR